MAKGEPHTPVLLSRLRAIHAALDAAGFDHAVGGAIALAFHVQEPRFTADIDLNVMADPKFPEPLLACMPEGVEIHRRAAAEIQRDGQTRLMWRDPETPVDLFLPQHPTYHRLVNDRAVEATFLGDGIKVLNATDLLVFKMLFDRSKDWVDIESLLANRSGDPDEATSWVAHILQDDGDSRIERLRRLCADVEGPH